MKKGMIGKYWRGCVSALNENEFCRKYIRVFSIDRTLKPKYICILRSIFTDKIGEM